MIKIEQKLRLSCMTDHPYIGLLRETRFENRRLEALGVEVISLDRLREKVSPQIIVRPERVDFFMLLYVFAGEGVHWVDFVEIPLSEGTLIVVRPGQVQRWHINDHYSAALVLVDPTALPYWGELNSVRDDDLLTLLDWQTSSQLTAPLSAEIAAALGRLETDINTFDDSALEVSLIRNEFLVLLLRIARWQRAITAVDMAQGRALLTYRLFLRELEKGFYKSHSLSFYAKRLGYSQSTISRACIAAEGRPAKSVIDRRIAMEAKRILIHTNLSVSEIGHDLGFSETTNFIKFFRRNVGTTPSRFRLQR